MPVFTGNKNNRIFHIFTGKNIKMLCAACPGYAFAAPYTRLSRLFGFVLLVGC